MQAEKQKETKMHMSTHLAPYTNKAYMSGEGLEGVDHVEAVEVDNSRGHGLVAKPHLVPNLQDKTCSFPTILCLLIHGEARLNAGRVPQLPLLIVPAGPLGREREINTVMVD